MPLPGMMPGTVPATGQTGGQQPVQSQPIEKHSINELEGK
jgi:hypothetical protein